MIWLTWRQLRAQLAAALALTAAAAVWLALTGPHVASISRHNTDVYDALGQVDRLLYQGGIVALAVVPALLGVFWGAPQVARELETGTYRLAWNQSVTRGRWLATKLACSALAAAVVAGALTLAITWWSHPLDGVQGDRRGSLPSRLTPVAFAMRGVVPVAYAVFAVLLGTLIGLVLRRSVAAMALTLAVYVVIQVAVPLWVRPHLVSARTETQVISQTTLDGILAHGSGPFQITTHTKNRKDWILSNRTVDADGHPASLPAWFADCLPPPPAEGSSNGTTQVSPGPGTMDDCLSRLTAEGYRQRLVYQPASHFWRLQWVESGLYLAASGVLAGLSFWWLRRRLS
jgi:ABC-2 family transporter protein